jgi:hypothetical protein
MKTSECDFAQPRLPFPQIYNFLSSIHFDFKKSLDAIKRQPANPSESSSWQKKKKNGEKTKFPFRHFYPEHFLS